MKPEIKAIIRECLAVSVEGKADYELRQTLSGCGITASIYSRQFYPVGTPEFKTLCCVLTTILCKRADKARMGIKRFNINVEYQIKGVTHIHGMIEEERTAEEARLRLYERQFYSPGTYRKIKTPKFTKVEISEN